MARFAGGVMTRNFTHGMAKEWKQDETPVTVTDTTINEHVLKSLQKEYPDHSFIGEEGSFEKESSYVWICDPVDGTIPFSHAVPTFVFSLGLVKDGESILGVIYDPTLDRMIVAEKGQGAYMNGKKIRVSETKQLGTRTYMNYGFDEYPRGRDQFIGKGCFVSTLYTAVYASMLVSMGEYVADIYGYTKPWDGAAVKCVVEEAGGKVTDIQGNAQRWDKPLNGYIASNGYVHEEIVQMLNAPSLRK